MLCGALSGVCWLLLLTTVQFCQADTSVSITDLRNGVIAGRVCIPVTKELNGWTAHLMFDQDVDSLSVTLADLTQVNNREYILVNKEDNRVRHVGDQLCLSLVGHWAGDVTPTATISIEGMDAPTSGSSGDNIRTKRSSGSKDYGQALAKSILFYDAQRSGKLPPNNPVPWRGDSGLGDCVQGGWYDAGDHIKFGLPMAASTTLLAWSTLRFKDGYQHAQQLYMMYDLLKWPLDYFLNAWDASNRILTVQVGEGSSDHDFWGRAEDMTMYRPCKKVTTDNKGSDIASETAAALAVGSMVFKDKGDSQYSSRLLSTAEGLYAFAKNNRGLFKGANGYYGSSDDKDELCEAAVWLYRATGRYEFLQEAKDFVDLKWGWALSWDDKTVVCQELLYEETYESMYREAVVGFFKGWLPGGSMTYTPCGLAWRDQWGANRYAGNAAFVALLAAEAGIETYTYRKWATEQINYLLGDNNHDGGCFSFEIGYGNKYPQQPHHRGASCPNRPAPCGYYQKRVDSPSPQILQGALVGGPDAYDRYNDRRTDYIQNEVALDYNAGFHGALAGISHLKASGQMPATNNKCPCYN